MAISISRFSVLGLHGRYNVSIPIRDNRLILVGVNGLGKTTVVNLMYYLLTMQWGKLIEFDYESLGLEISGECIVITRNDVAAKLRLLEREGKILARYSYRSNLPSKIMDKIIWHPLTKYALSQSNFGRSRVVKDISRDLEIPVSLVERALSELPRYHSDDLFDESKEPESVLKLSKILKSSGQEVIYLPTYRRIEQDLKTIFPDIDDDDLGKITSRTSARIGSQGIGAVELVQFGMRDVEGRINEELGSIRERNRSSLTSLMASYLKDIISNRADEVKTDILKNIGDESVSHVLERVDENILSRSDKEEVGRAIGMLRSGRLDARDRYLVYFFSRLLDIYLNLSDSESNIIGLVDTCNKYFVGKRLRYDDVQFSVSIKGSDDSDITWKMLSSGEKQVASLFTHLHLSKNKQQIVIIDEPELSLSVQWQEALLPDISSSGACSLLVAVTHSPFIYSNDLDKYAVDLSKYISSCV